MEVAVVGRVQVLARRELAVAIRNGVPARETLSPDETAALRDIGPVRCGERNQPAWWSPVPVPAQRRRGEALACPGLCWNSFEMGNAVRWDTATCGNLRTPSEARSEQKHQAQGRATVDVCSSNGMAAYAPTESCTLGNDTKRTHRPHHAPVLRRQARGVELASRCPER